MAKHLYTVGYELCEIDEFVEALKANRVRCLADVRNLPVAPKWQSLGEESIIGEESLIGGEHLKDKKLGAVGTVRNPKR